jgi:lipopolysaccharide transport system ATP-binding protein
MSDFIISVENLSKSYLVGHQSARRERLLRDVIGREARNFARKAVDFVHGRQIVQGDEVEEFWALKNVSFKVKLGEVLGIIGRNGAGKSTLLKILSRITEPTEGQVELRGRTASLLEVGTGFHPELSGRENIFLNGAVLGMTQREIQKRFDEIVAFAEVGKFLDTPVKHYSSGLHVRLAFAVAAHLEPEILIVDEVLAVGDSKFQKKCLGKMNEVSQREGRTILFVSHNLAAISELTHRTLLLDSGRIIADCPTKDAISSYLQDNEATMYFRPQNKPTSSPHIRQVEVVTSDANGIHKFGEPLEVKFRVKHDRPITDACLQFRIINQFGQRTIYASTYNSAAPFGNINGETILTCHFPHLRLNVGKFYLEARLDEYVNDKQYDVIDGICPFEVIRTDAFRWPWQPEWCAYHEELNWSVDSIGPNELVGSEVEKN